MQIAFLFKRDCITSSINMFEFFFVINFKKKLFVLSYIPFFLLFFRKRLMPFLDFQCLSLLIQSQKSFLKERVRDSLSLMFSTGISEGLIHVSKINYYLLLYTFEKIFRLCILSSSLFRNLGLTCMTD